MTWIFGGGLPVPAKEDASCHGNIVSYSHCENVSDKAKRDVFGCLLVGFDVLMSNSDV